MERQLQSITMARPSTSFGRQERQERQLRLIFSIEGLSSAYSTTLTHQNTMNIFTAKARAKFKFGFQNPLTKN